MYLVIKQYELEVDNGKSGADYKILAKYCHAVKVALFEHDHDALDFIKDKDGMIIIDCEKGEILEQNGYKFWEAKNAYLRRSFIPNCPI